MVNFYQLFLNTDDVILKLYTSLCQKAKCTLFVWSTVHVCVLYECLILLNIPMHVHIISSLETLAKRSVGT